MEVPQLTEEERDQILQEIEQREILEKAAIEQEKVAKQQQAELEYRQSLADATKKLEEERKERVLASLATALKLTQEALQAFEQGNERHCYVLLAKTDPCFIAAKHKLNQAPERPSGGTIPTIRVKRAGIAQGWCIVNAEDVLPSDEIILGGNTND